MKSSGRKAKCRKCAPAVPLASLQTSAKIMENSRPRLYIAGGGRLLHILLSLMATPGLSEVIYAEVSCSYRISVWLRHFLCPPEPRSA